MIGARKNPVLTSVVLAGYLLAVTASGWLHDHSSHSHAGQGHCGGEQTGCAEQVANDQTCDHTACSQTAERSLTCEASSENDRLSPCGHDHDGHRHTGSAAGGCSHDRPASHAHDTQHAATSGDSVTASSSVHDLPQRVPMEGCPVCHFLATLSLTGPAAVELPAIACTPAPAQPTLRCGAQTFPSNHFARGPPAAA